MLDGGEAGKGATAVSIVRRRLEQKMSTEFPSWRVSRVSDTTELRSGSDIFGCGMTERVRIFSFSVVMTLFYSSMKYGTDIPRKQEIRTTEQVENHTHNNDLLSTAKEVQHSSSLLTFQ